MSERRECRVLIVDGEMVRIQGGTRPPTEEDLAALTELVRTVKAKRQAERDLIGPHEHQWKSPWRDGRQAGSFCTICRDRWEAPDD